MMMMMKVQTGVEAVSCCASLSEKITQTILFIVLHSKDESDPIVHWDSRHTCPVTQEICHCVNDASTSECVCACMYVTRFCDLCGNSTTRWSREGLHGAEACSHISTHTCRLSG